MLRAEESLLNSKDDLLEKTERIYAHRTNTQRCWQAASRVLILTPLLLSIVLFVVYFRDVAKPLDLVAGNTTTKPQITANKGMKRDFGIFLHPEDHVLREPNVLRLSWNITKAIIAPDGVEKNVFLINGQFPGPTIEARPGDILEVNIWNHVEEGVSIHWHGLHMRGANQMDGPVGITQCGVKPGDKFTYRVPIGEQAGTFWYHAHSEVHRGDGLYGALIVHNVSAEADSYAHDKELLLLVGDWYHRPADWLLARFQERTSTGNEPNPDSLLINGLGRFNCSKATHGNPVNCSSVEPPQLSLDKGMRYKVRLVNVGSLAGISISIPDSDMNISHVDGGLPVISRTANSIGVLYPGERLDFSLSWPKSTLNTNTQITIEIDKEMFILSNPALTRIQSFLLEADSHLQQSIGDQTDAELRRLNLDELEGFPLETSLPEPDVKFMIYTTVQILNALDDDIRALINRTYWETPSVPLIASQRDTWSSHQLVPWTGDKPVWVELTINNIDINGHPFHLHGFDFYVVGLYEGHSGWNAYNPFDLWSSPRGGPFNLVNPIRKDTVLVPKSGYAVIRFLADNEGIWALHCHVLWHQASGMTMALQVLGDETKGFSEYASGRDALEQCMR